MEARVATLKIAVAILLLSKCKKELDIPSPCSIIDPTPTARIYKMTIECFTDEQFYNAVKGMVERGLTFTSNATTRVITLTGGF